MRDASFVEAAQAGIQLEKTSEAVTGLPPGYFSGFHLEVDDDGRLTVGPGVANIKAHRLEHKETYILDFTNFVNYPSVATLCTYYLYYSTVGQFMADVVDAEYDPEYFGYYHPVFQDYRFIGQFYLGANRAITEVVSQDPVTRTGIEAGSVTTNALAAIAVTAAKIAAQTITADKVAATTLQALFLSIINSIIIGYRTTGTGTNDVPEEGDTRLYIDGDEIGFEERTGGAWSTVGKIKIGGAIAGIFLSMIGCSGIYNIDQPPSNAEQLPNSQFKVFNFEDSLVSEDGTVTLSGTNTAYTTTKKFGTKAVTKDTAANSSISGDTGWTVGESCIAGCWLNSTLNSTTTYSTIINYYESSNNYIALRRGPGNLGLSGNIYLRVVKNGTAVIDDIDTGLDFVSGEYGFIGFYYDATTDKVTATYNGNTYTSATAGGSWGAGTGYYSQLIYVDSAGWGGTAIIDELVFCNSAFDSIDFFIQHYIHNVAWNATYAKGDIALLPKTGNRVYISEALKVIGAITGSSTINIAGAGTIGGTLTVTGGIVPSGSSLTAALATATVYTIAHGISVVPSLFTVVFVCITTDAGYAVGDEVYPTWTYDAASYDSVHTLSADTTNITFITGNTLLLKHKTSATTTLCTYSKWKARVRWWK